MLIVIQTTTIYLSQVVMNCVAILLPLKWILVAADGFSGNVEACHKKNSWVLSLEFSGPGYLTENSLISSLLLFGPPCDVISTLQFLLYKPEFFYSKLSIYSTQAILLYYIYLHPLIFGKN